MTNDNRSFRTFVQQIEMPVAGISFNGRQGVAWGFRKASNANGKSWLELRRESTNEYDENAIAVIAHTETFHAQVGYVPKELAGQLAPIMDAGGKLRISAYNFVGGYKGRALGMRLTVNIYR